MIYTVSNGKYEISVNSLGAELISVKCENGFEAMWQGGKGYWSKHAPVLFPVCGRLKDQQYTLGGVKYDIPTHGFINKSEFDVYELGENKISLISEWNEETLKMYPFKFRFIAEYSVTENGVHAEYKISNENSEEMPYMFGWHPAFAYPASINTLDDLTLDFGDAITLKYHPLMNSVFVNPEYEEIVLKDGDYKIDTEYLYSTDTIIVKDTRGFVNMKSDSGDYTLSLKWSDNLPVLAIWKYPDNGARYLCLEPWSSLPADGVTPENFDTRDMLRLAPRAAEIFTYDIEIDN